MGFFEFDSELFETARSTAPRSSSGGAQRVTRSPSPARTSPTASRTPSTTTPRGSSTTPQRSSSTTTPRSSTTTGRAPAPTPGGRAAQPGPSRTTTPQRAPARTSGGAASSGGGLGSLASTLGRVTSYAQQAWDFAQAGVQGVQSAQQFLASLGLGAPPGGQPPAGAPPPGAVGQPPGAVDTGTPTSPALPPGAPPGAAGAPTPAPDTGAAPPPQPQQQPQPQPQPYATGMQPMSSADIGMLLQALRQHQIPPLPAPAMQPVMPGPQPAAVPGAQPQPDALGLLRVILTNPQFQQALQSSPAMGAPAQRTVQLPVPAPTAPQQMRSAQIPLGAVLNTILALTGPSMRELNESTSEEDPEIPSYLVDDNGDFLVDPASADDRAALVAHLFRLSDEAQRAGYFPQPASEFSEAEGELDESERWAHDAGFIK